MEVLLVEISDIGRGEVESDKELIPEVLAESVPLMLFCTKRLSAGMGMGLTTELETGDPALMTDEVSATVLVTVGETSDSGTLLVVSILCCGC